MKKYNTILTIAGSDSIGGAGIQADIKTATALGVYSMSVITAITAQNTTGVRTYEPVSPQLLEAQLRAVLDDVTPDAVKIGMVPTAEAVEVIAKILENFKLKNIVADPVCVATSGDSLASRSVPEALSSTLFPYVDLITPNIPEAELFLGHKMNQSVIESAQELADKSEIKAVLIKGGHLSDPECSEDTLYYKNSFYTFRSPRIQTENTHGTGCSLSSAIACFLSMGKTIPEAVESAKKWISEAIQSGADFEFGHGHGPINHLFKIQQEWK